MRFHLLDRIVEISYGEYITGIKCITLADDVFDEHFPGYPVFPGSLIMEGLAQLGGSFFELMMDHRGEPVKRSILSIVHRMKFRRPARPGDRLLYRADLDVMRDDYGVMDVRADVDEDVCAEGKLTFTFKDIADEQLHDSRMELYKICMRDARVIE